VSISKNIKVVKFEFFRKLIFEYISRVFAFIFTKQNIYFTYKSYLNHPAFSELLINPPVFYSNKRNSKLLHLIQGGTEKDYTNNCIIEVIDHPLSVLAPFLAKDLNCKDYINNLELAEQIYASKNVKKVLLISFGQLELFKSFFTNSEILNKIQVLPLPWKNNISCTDTDSDNNLSFLFIASDFLSKGVEIVLDAWLVFKMTNKNAQMDLVCHNFPEEKLFKLHKSITLFRNVPLKRDLKDFLYSKADVVIATSLTDGVTPIEATSYGKPIIVFRGQHSYDFINNSNGFCIDVPINYYDEGYGSLWETDRSYFELVKHKYLNGDFDFSIIKLVDSFNFFLNNENLKLYKYNAIVKYKNSYQVINRNIELMEIYKKHYPKND
jgi:hypothetical protein